MANVSKADPGYSAASVTPSDTGALTPTRWVYVGGGGDVKVDMADGTTVTFVSVTAGTMLPIQVQRIYSTDTTATSIVAIT